MPDVSQACPRCGAVLTAADAGALCPRCLITGVLGLGAEDEPGSGDTAPPFLESFGEYELLGVVARGGMGTVYRARQIRLNRVVALKLIRGGPSAGPAEVRRFRLEAEAAAQLEHPNIVPIYEVGEHAGRHFFSMKLVEGGSLAEASPAEGGGRRWTAAGAAALVAKVARAVHFAHQRGVLHRDLKPANILMEPSGEPLVADFGLAKMVNTDSEVTLWGSVLGTPSYMAPEQAEGGAGQATVSSDVYSLGAILYHMLTGRPPFTGRSTLDVLRKVIADDPVPPSRCKARRENAEGKPVSADVSPDLEAICLKCLEKDPVRRYVSAEALALDLERWQRGEPLEAVPAGPWVRSAKWVRRHPAAAALMAVSAVALAGYVALLRVNERELTRERDRALLQERRATVAAERAALNEAVTRTNLYVADVALALRAIEEGNLGLARRALEAHVPEVDAPDLRGFAWHHAWRRAQGDPARVLRGHGKAVTALAFSRDAATLMSAGREGQARFWDVASGGERLALPPVVNGDPGPTETAALAPVLLGSPDTLALLVAGATPAAVSFRSRTTTLGDVRTAALSPDGQWMAAGGEGTFVRVWHVGRRQVEFVIPATHARSLAFAADSRHLWVGTGAGTEPAHPAWVRAYDLESHQRAVEMPSPTGVLALSPDGRAVAVAGLNGTIEVRDASLGNLLRAWPWPERVHALAWSPDGQVLAALVRASDEVQLWSAADGRSLGVIHAGTRIWSMAFGPDHRSLALAGADHAVRLWDIDGLVETRVWRGHEDEVLAVAFSPDGRWLASSGKDAMVRLWPSEPGESESVLAARWPVLISQDGRHVVSAQPNGPLALVGSAVVPLDDSVGERVLGCLEQGTGFVTVAPGSGSVPAELRFRAYGPDAPVRVVPLPEAPASWRSGAVAANRGICALAHEHGVLSFFDITTGALRGRIEWPRRESMRPFFSADGSRLAAFRWPNRFRVWDTDSHRLLSEFKTVDGAMQAMTLSPDGRLLACGGDDNVITVFEAASGNVVTTLRGHKAEVKALAFAPDGLTLASSSTDQTIKLWHVPTWRELGTVRREGLFTFLAFAGDGPDLFAGEYQRGLRRLAGAARP